MPTSKRKPKPRPRPKSKTKPKRAQGARKLTPVLYVPRIEPCLDLWVTRLGFTKVVELPEGSAAGFVILKKGDAEVMYQTMASVAKDIPAFASRATGMSNLYVEVDDIDATERALAGLTLVVPRRTTFYGATEVGVADAGGNVILFAQVGG